MCFFNTKTNMRGGPASDVWSSTTLTSQYKNQNENFSVSGISLQKAFKIDEDQCMIHYFYRQTIYRSFFLHQSVKIMSFVNKYKISLS